MADETTEEVRIHFSALFSAILCTFFQTQFVVDEVSNIIKESIENTIGGNGYAHAKVSQWTNAVVESCLASLTKLQKPFKYIGKIVKTEAIQNFTFFDPIQLFLKTLNVEVAKK